MFPQYVSQTSVYLGKADNYPPHTSSLKAKELCISSRMWIFLVLAITNGNLPWCNLDETTLLSNTTSVITAGCKKGKTNDHVSKFDELEGLKRANKRVAEMFSNM